MRGRAGGIRRVIWRDAPILYGPMAAAVIAHAEMVHLDPPRPDLLITFLFPLIAPLALVALRRGVSHRSVRVVEVAAVCLALALALLAATIAPRAPRSDAWLRRVYEIGTLGVCVLLLVHAWTHDRRLVASLLGPAALYGAALENGGILLGYFSEMNYRL